ncbi:MAG: NAD-glutamate dehydrogenase [Candidatus Nanopelagicales bacterium]
MSQFGESDLAAFSTALQSHFHNGSEVHRRLAKWFIHKLAMIDFRHVSVDSLADAITQIHALAAHRQLGEAHVRMVARPETTYLLIVTDDMSFLVDSVTMALSASGRTVQSMLHPQLAIQRDDDGSLSEVLELWVDETLPAGAHAESWMIINLQPARAAGDDAAIEELMRRVLQDVRVANEDWHPMMKKAASIAATLRRTPPVGPEAADVTETIDLLQWLLDDNFTFLGYREYRIVGEAEDAAITPIAASGLGILRLHDDEVPLHTRALQEMPAAAVESTLDNRMLIVNKSSWRSTVHRRGFADHIGIKTFDERGRVIGEQRFYGLFTSEAYAASVLGIPLIRKRVQAVMDALDLVPDSHSARDLLQFLETYPRDELFQTHAPQLVRVAAAAGQLRALRQTRLFVRIDDYARFVSCIVYLPRDRYNTVVRTRLDSLLKQTFTGVSSEYTALVTESLLARVHFVVQVEPGTDLAAVDLAELEARASDATKSWDDRWTDAVVAALDEASAQALLSDFEDAFPEAYKEDFDAAEALADALSLQSLEGESIGLRWLDDPTRSGAIQFKVNRVGDEISVSRLLPVMQHMGLEVLAERPYSIERSRGISWVLDFDVRLTGEDFPERESLPARASETFRAVWMGHCEDDRYNALVMIAGLTWQEAAVLRAYGHYLKQIGVTYSQSFLQSVLAGNAGIARQLVELFHARLDPSFAGDRVVRAQELRDSILHALDAVKSLDQDRVLRSFLSVVTATLRTNVFLGPRAGGALRAMSFKLDARSIADVPLPRPKYEIWVCSPRVEGVHLRFGDVARGGLRWSDRSEDFRTEILGLVKAQEVKNAVIVPVGAKGGFVPAHLPDPAIDRAAWLAEGQGSYREYLCSLLDITDNLVDGTVVPPAGVVRHDGDDPYLVVAADKGTATFSDLANSVASEYGFWLDDAFASGGSVGYDHKAMGITARGAWEAVKRHFRELGVDTQSQDFTAVGIGDMSGDVFGNGMMLSPHMHLIAAFDHRDIFLDPNPEAVTSLAERQRLFALPRSSWADYNTSLISPGGGVFSRSLKSIELSAAAMAALGLAGERNSFSPAEVIAAILRAPVDLLWNGGIGTYVKARSQSHAEVGDKANDAIRVNGDELRCRVVGEGGNLGCTQMGRIEAARAGIRINTDAIDNSAGVDTSDHEVNIKILLQPLLATGTLSADERVALLSSMTEEVAEHVLADNYGQNVVLGLARTESSRMLSVDRRMIAELEKSGLLDRALEYLPSDAELGARAAAQQGLFSPEFCVLLAYSKISLIHALAEGGLADDPWYSVMLRRYFPRTLVEHYPDLLDRHPLRAQIINTVTCNSIVNIGGINFVYRAMEETNSPAVDVVKAATVVIEVFGLQSLWDRVNALDNRVPTAEQDRMQLEMRRLLDRATRWILQRYGSAIDVAGMIEQLQPLVATWSPEVPMHIRGVERANLEALRDEHVRAGVPIELAAAVVSLLDSFALLDVFGIAANCGESPETILPLYYEFSERYEVDPALTRITRLRRDSRWDTLARLALRSDLYAATASIVERIAGTSPADLPAAQRVDAWEESNRGAVQRAKATLAEISALDEPTLASMSVLLRVMRNLAS